MDENVTIESILSRADEGFRVFREELHARFIRLSTLIAGISTIVESPILTQQMMLPDINHIDREMADLKQYWTMEEQEQSIHRMHKHNNTSRMKSDETTQSIQEKTNGSISVPNNRAVNIITGEKNKYDYSSSERRTTDAGKNVYEYQKVYGVYVRCLSPKTKGWRDIFVDKQSVLLRYVVHLSTSVNALHRQMDHFQMK